MKHTIWEWMEIGSQKGASDIHIISGLAPKCRVDGEITDLGDEVLTAEECDEFAKTLAGEEYVCFNTCGEWDGAAEIDGLRC